MKTLADFVRGSVLSRRPRVKLTPLLLALPLILVLLIFFIPPITLGVVQSFFKYDPWKGIIRVFNIENYAKLLSDPFYLNVIWRTIRLSAISALISLLIGYPVAYFIVYKAGRFRSYIILAILSPLMVMVVIRAAGWYMLLLPSGAVNRLLIDVLGIIDKPIPLLNSEIGVVVGLVHSDIAFMILPLISSLRKIDPNLIWAARNLGASSLGALLRITLPLSIPGMLAGTVIVFALAAASWATPAILGGDVITVMTTFVYRQMIMFLNWPLGSAMAAIILVIVGGIILLTTRFVERGRFAGVFH